MPNPYRVRKGKSPLSLALLVVGAFVLGILATRMLSDTDATGAAGLVELALAEPRALRSGTVAAPGVPSVNLAHARSAEVKAELKAEVLRAKLAAATAAQAKREAELAAARAGWHKAEQSAVASAAEAAAARAAAARTLGAQKPVAAVVGAEATSELSDAGPPLVTYDYGNDAAPRPWPLGMSRRKWEGHLRGEGMLYILTGCCSRFCDWQAVVGVHAAAQRMLADQSIIRFAACDVGEGRSIGPAAEFGRTEVFSHGSDNLPSAGPGVFYPPLSKSRSLARWVTTAEAKSLPDALNIALIDEDFLMLEPLQPSAKQGEPVAQDWNDAFHGSAWLNTPIKSHCRGSCEGMTHAEARQHEAGPPYTMTLGDLRRVAPLWHELTVEILHKPESRKAAEWLVDMYSYVLASIILGLKHTLRTDWQTTFVETFHEVNGPFGFARMADRGVHEHQQPAFLHYCQPYKQPNSKGGVFKLSKHALHERGPDGPGLLSCSAEVSDERLLSSLVMDGQGSFETSLLELGTHAAERKRMLAELDALTASASTYQDALQLTIHEDGPKAAAARSSWIFANLYTGMRAAFKEFRLRMCKEPMDGF